MPLLRVHRLARYHTDEHSCPPRPRGRQDLDEFDDVSVEEKLFMKLWNAFSRSYRCGPRRHTAGPATTPRPHASTRPAARLFSQRDVPAMCVDFGAERGAELAAHHLRPQFLLHLMHLWENSMISSADLDDALTAADTAAHAAARTRRRLSAAASEAEAEAVAGPAGSLGSGVPGVVHAELRRPAAAAAAAAPPAPVAAPTPTRAPAGARGMDLGTGGRQAVT